MTSANVLTATPRDPSLLLPNLHLEVLDLGLGGEGDAFEGQGEENEVAGFKEELMVVPGHFEAAFDDGEDVGGGDAEVKALAAFDFAGVDAKEGMIGKEADADGWVARVFGLDEGRLEVGKVDARQRFADVQGAGFAVEPDAVPVEHAIGSV
jgi:hypothetical protein